MSNEQKVCFSKTKKKQFFVTKISLKNDLFSFCASWFSHSFYLFLSLKWKNWEKNNLPKKLHHKPQGKKNKIDSGQPIIINYYLFNFYYKTTYPDHPSPPKKLISDHTMLLITKKKLKHSSSYKTTRCKCWFSSK